MAAPFAARVLLLLTGAAAYEAATRAPGESATLLRSYHSREVAACRRKGNLYGYYAPMGRCMPLMESNSPCPRDEQVLVLNATTLEAQCMTLPCDVTHVLLPDGGCHTKEEFCDHAEDKELVLKETGYGTCDCPDLHVYWQADGRCYAAYTRGPCAEGEYVVFREDVGVLCEATPCPEGQVPWRNECVPRSGHGCLDSKHGHLVLNPANLKYECTLRCPDGMAEVELDCYDLYSRGPCPPGEYVVHVEGSQLGRCEENPCGEDGLMPWDDRCWQRGQYCADDTPPPAPSSLGVHSEGRQPQKREPVLLPDDDHLVILDRDDLRPAGPPSGWVVSEPLLSVAQTSAAGAPPPPPSKTGPASGDRPSVPQGMVPPPPPPGPAPPMRLGAGQESHLVELPSPHFGQTLEQIAAFNSILPPPSRLGQSYGQIAAQNFGLSSPSGFSQPGGHAPPQPSVVLPPPHFNQPSGQVPSQPSVLPPPPHVNQPSRQVPSQPSVFPPPTHVNQPSGQVPSQHSVLPPPFHVNQPSGQVPSQHSVLPPPPHVNQPSGQVPSQPSALLPLPHVNQPSGQVLSQYSVAPPPPQFSQQAAFRPQVVPPPQRPTQTNTGTVPIAAKQTSSPVQLPSGEQAAQPAGGPQSHVPSLAHSYLPPPPPPPPSAYLPPPSSSLVKRQTSAPAAAVQLDISDLQPFAAPAPSAGGRSRRSARLESAAEARFAELLESNGFVGIDDDHPFNGNFETLSAVQGLHINVNPLTYQVECSDAIGYYRTISFAHYKCRPGSRRDLLGECHHEGPDWTDYHPDRCPFGKRHNLLTGKCIRDT